MIGVTWVAGLAFGWLGAATLAKAQFGPVALRLVRRTGFNELMGKNHCVVGDLYQTVPSFPISDPGSKVSNTLELAYRNNLNQISAIKSGTYEGFVRMDGPRGWRVELVGTEDRKHIQLHIGNRPSDTVGCILPGVGNSTDSSCQIAGSKDAMAKLRAIVGDNPNVKVLLLVQS